MDQEQTVLRVAARKVRVYARTKAGRAFLVALAAAFMALLTFDFLFYERLLAEEVTMPHCERMAEKLAPVVAGLRAYYRKHGHYPIAKRITGQRGLRALVPRFCKRVPKPVPPFVHLCYCSMDGRRFELLAASSPSGGEQILLQYRPGLQELPDGCYRVLDDWVRTAQYLPGTGEGVVTPEVLAQMKAKAPATFQSLLPPR